jgi:hypothetical protein
MAVIFSHFLLETGSLICSGNSFQLLADVGNSHTITNLFELQRETFSRY